MELIEKMKFTAEKHPELAEMLTEAMHYLENPLELFCKKEAEKQLLLKNYHGASEKTINEIAAALISEKHEICNALKILNKENINGIINDYVDKHFSVITFQMVYQGISLTCKTEKEKEKAVKKQMEKIYKDHCRGCETREDAVGTMIYYIMKNGLSVMDIITEYDNQDE